jgi:hypothetical protein
VANARNIDENVNAANVSCRASTIGFVAHIEVNEFSTDTLRDRLAVGLFTIGHPNRGSRSSKDFRNRSSNAGRSTRHKSNFRFEPEHNARLSL